ncbi:MAG: hypothetical protein JXR20_07955 [Balneola sp.]
MKNLVLLSILLLLFSNCSDNGLNFNLSEIEEDYSYIENPKERWEAYQLNDYYIKQSWGCFCTPPYGADLYIQNNELTSFDLINNTSGSLTDNEKQNSVSNILTINEAFVLIEKNKEIADSIRVEYDTKYGYPIIIEIDYVKSSIDDEIIYSFRDLKRIN